MPYHIRGGHSVLGNPEVRYATGFRIAFLHKYMSVLLHLFITPFWVAKKRDKKCRLDNTVAGTSNIQSFFRNHHSGRRRNFRGQSKKVE